MNKTEYLKLTDLKKLPNNPRVIKDKEFNTLVKSIKDNPDYFEARPIICSDRTGELIILAGNQRYEAAKKLNLKSVPVYVIKGLTEERENEIIIRDNISNGKWDFDELANSWDTEKLIEWGMDLPEEWGKVEPEATEDGYEIPDTIETDIVVGDLFEIGQHRLLCGDSTDSDAVAKLMNGEKADMVTDPPYGIGIDGQKESICKNPKHNRKKHEFRGWDNERPQKETFDFLLSITNDSVIWGGNYFADLLPASRGWLYWNKGQDGLTMSDGELAWTSLNKPLRHTVVNRAELQGSVHPTQKPVSVITFSIKYLQSKESTIFDPFGGSGTTMVSCHQLNRKARLMELDPKYCQVIIDRMRKLDPSLAIKRNGELMA